MVMVTHHVEEIPPSFTHALLLKDGEVFDQGTVEEVITSDTISELFDRPLIIDNHDGRLSARSDR